MDLNKFKILFFLFLLNIEEERAENEQPTKPALIETETSRFRELSKCKYYIDKTEFISHYLDGKKFIIVNAPRRFGKTHNMDMLKEFLEIKVKKDGKRKDNSETKKLFKNFKVFEDSKLIEKHLGQYPVIHIDFKNENIHSSECVLEGLKHALHLAYKQHGYLIQSRMLNESMKSEFNLYFDTEKHKQLGIDKVISGITFLSFVLYTHFQKMVHVFIDEYDSPIRYSMYKSEIHVEDVAELIFSMYVSGLEGNQKYVERAFLTGITFDNAGTFIDYQRFGFLNDHHLAKFYGATDNEVQELFTKLGMNKDRLLEAEEWYGGYRTCMSGINIFNMGSIVNFCREKKAQSYWQSSGNADNLNSLFKVAKISNEMNKLIIGYNINYQFNEINVEDLKDFNELIINSQFSWVKIDKVLTLMLEMGYITYAMPIKESAFYSTKNCTLTLPNKETKAEFVNVASYYYQLKCGFVWRKTILALNYFNASADRNAFANFVTLFQSFAQTFIDQKDHYCIIDEITFQSSLYVMLCQTKFVAGTEVIDSEKEKRSLIFVTTTENKVLIILALLYKRSANEAFEQVERSLCGDLLLSESKYRETNISVKIMVGLNIDQHFNVTMKYQINDDANVLIP